MFPDNCLYLIVAVLHFHLHLPLFLPVLDCGCKHGLDSLLFLRAQVVELLVDLVHHGVEGGVVSQVTGNLRGTLLLLLLWGLGQVKPPTQFLFFLLLQKRISPRWARQAYCFGHSVADKTNSSMAKTYVFLKIARVYLAIPFFILNWLEITGKLIFGSIFSETFAKNWEKFCFWLADFLSFFNKFAWVFGKNSLSFLRNVQKRPGILLSLFSIQQISFFSLR